MPSHKRKDNNLILKDKLERSTKYVKKISSHIFFHLTIYPYGIFSLLRIT